jgi:hypothetical protein
LPQQGVVVRNYATDAGRACPKVGGSLIFQNESSAARSKTTFNL